MADAPILALDFGTNSIRAMLFTSGGERIRSARRPIAFLPSAVPPSNNARFEQDPGAMLAAARDAIAKILASGPEPACVGIAVQRSSVAFWDRRSGRPLAPVIGWQDTRAADQVAALAEHAKEIAARSGLRLSPHYGASKLRWALRNLNAVSAAAMDGCLRMGPLAAWLLRGLAAGDADLVDHVNASRSQLWNLERRDWDPRLCELFEIDAACLPACRPVRSHYGELADSNIAIRALSGDQNAALFADGPLPERVLCVNLGTGAFALRATGSRAVRDERLLSGIADGDADGVSYLLEGTVNGAGAALLDAEREHGLRPIAPRIDELCQGGTPPLLYRNAVGGLGSPWWLTGIRSRAFVAGAAEQSLRLDGGAALALGVVESVLFLLKVNIDRIAQAAGRAESVHVSGGLAASGELCRRLASLVELPVERPTQLEATARGIAWLAAGRPEEWAPSPSERFEARPDAALRDRYESWLVEMEKLA